MVMSQLEYTGQTPIRWALCPLYGTKTGGVADLVGEESEVFKDTDSERKFRDISKSRNNDPLASSRPSSGQAIVIAADSVYVTCIALAYELSQKGLSDFVLYFAYYWLVTQTLSVPEDDQNANMTQARRSP